MSTEQKQPTTGLLKENTDGNRGPANEGAGSSNDNTDGNRGSANEGAGLAAGAQKGNAAVSPKAAAAVTTNSATAVLVAQEMGKGGLGLVVRRTLVTHKVLACVTLICIVLAVVSALLPPLLLEQIINRLTGQLPISWAWAGAYFGLLACAGICEAGQNMFITVFGQKITHGLRSELCAKLGRLPAAYFTKHEPGKITSRFVNDVDVVDSLFTNGIISMVADACQVLSILAVVFYKSRGLGVVLLLVTPVLFVLTRQFQRRMLQAQLANREAVAKVNNHVPETIRNIRMIRNLFRQKYMERRYDAYIEESYRATDAANLYDSIYSPIIIFISAVVIAIMMVCAATGGAMQQFFGLTVGTAVAIIAYVGKIFSPLESIGMEIQNIQGALAGIKRVNEFLEEPERVVPQAPVLSGAANIVTGAVTSVATDVAIDVTTGVATSGATEMTTGVVTNTATEITTGVVINTATGVAAGANLKQAEAFLPGISFNHVTFGYDQDRTILQNLCFTVAPGETVTLVGRTGAGKSTAFRLLLGLYQPQTGRVLVAGQDAASIPESAKRRLFGYVEQSFHLVEGTVGEQISLFASDIGQEQIEEAAKMVGLHESILQLPQGYGTPAAAVTFSQGQFQLLSIARAVVAAPRILLLDEITANLDSGTEQRVLVALERACQGRTVLSISHRLQEYAQHTRLVVIGQCAAGS